MAKKSSAKSKRLVVDASVLRASGGPSALHPTAARCRDFLMDVLTICHRVFLSDSCRDEWRRHASKFARDWWVAMEARRKVERAADMHDPEVRRPLKRAVLTTKERDAIAKDIHLLEDALRADGIVVGIDLILVAYVQKAAKTARKLRKVRFIDPVAESASAI